MRWRFTSVFAFAISFSASYAYFELHGSPCSLLPWCSNDWMGMSFSQYGFMLPLFSFVSLLPVLKDIPWKGKANFSALGTFLLMVLSEDSIYFLLEKRAISPGLYTTQWGYVSILGFALPYWYVFFGGGAVASFYLSTRWESLKPALLNTLKNWKYSSSHYRLSENNFSR